MDNPLPEVKKDMSDHFNQKISDLLDEIQFIKQEMLTNKKLIFLLNFKLHSLFLKLYEKAEQKDPGHIKKQQKYQLFFQKKKVNLIRTKKVENRYGDIETRESYSKKYPNLVKLLEHREIHLNKILEQLNLTSASKENRKIRV